MSKKKSLAAKIEKQPVSAKGRVELEGKIEKTKTRSARRKSFVMDLRVHSPHSQGYFGVDGIDTAPAIVSLAKVKKLDFIAVTDYHSASFIDELVTAAKGSPVTVFPGVDLRCTLAGCDDVVLTALFPDTVTGKEVGELLDRLGIPSEARGMRKYRVRTPFDEIVKLIEERNGLIIPSRMDQTPYRLSVVPTL
ncbi:MAG: hypothetical protein KDD53_03245, partial [Bdellovibrionales bacterium]|nr:hypothetical protein [Bdellovibrionales bacterium]